MSYTSHWLMFLVTKTTINKVYLILSYLILQLVAQCHVSYPTGSPMAETVQQSTSSLLRLFSSLHPPAVSYSSLISHDECYKFPDMSQSLAIRAGIRNLIQTCFSTLTHWAPWTFCCHFCFHISNSSGDKAGILLYQYRVSHYKDTIVQQPSYLFNENPYTLKDCFYIRTKG